MLKGVPPCWWILHFQHLHSFNMWQRNVQNFIDCANKWKKSEAIRQLFQYLVDTGRKLNVHKTFRRRPGRLRNVLCKFNVCPVSTGWILVLNWITNWKVLLNNLFILTKQWRNTWIHKNVTIDQYVFALVAGSINVSKDVHWEKAPSNGTKYSRMETK